MSCFSLAAVLVMGGFLYTNYRQAQIYKGKLNLTYQHAFSELVFTMSEIDASLQKALYSTTPAMISSVCSEIYAKATSAQMAMGEMPLSGVELEQSTGYIAKLGDYAFMLGRKAAAGETVTQEEYDNLSALADSASFMSQNLTMLFTDVSDGVVTIEQTEKTEEVAASGEDSTLPASVSDSFTTLEGEFPEIPSLIYDGPFSQHILQMKPSFLEGLPSVDEKRALESAETFSGIKNLKIFSERSGTVPVYIFTADTTEGTVYIEVTKQGGYVDNMTTSAVPQEENLTAKNGVRLAENFLKKQGYYSMATSYYMVKEGTLTVNFAYMQDGVICYPDLVKVGVSLETGMITGFENLGYIMSHHTRDIQKAAVTETEAAAKVSPRLKILSHNLTIIPTNGKNEVFCHEFKCENEDGKHFITYINANNGREEKLLILLEDESGTLTL